jgi:hypothetical protein
MMRWMRSGLRLCVRLFAFLAAKVLFLLAVAAISLSFSIASFAIPALASLMSAATNWIVGSTAVATLTETRSLRQQAQALQRSNQDITRRNRTLAESNSDLAARNQRLATENTRLQDQISRQRRATAGAARRIGQRAVRTTTRSIAAIPLESVPILGVSTIIATTAWEIRDTCSTLDDMAELHRYFGEEPDTSFAARACETVSLHGARVAHYGDMRESECRAEAEAARARVFELADRARDEVPDLFDSGGAFDVEIGQAAENEFVAISDICDCIADLACDPDELAQR